MTTLEARIQSDIVRYLQSEGVFCHSIPNEAGGRSAVMQMQLSSMGMRPGAADLVVWWPSGHGIRIGYLEVKNERGRQSEQQRRFEARCIDAGIDYELARDVMDVKEMLRKHRSEW